MKISKKVLFALISFLSIQHVTAQESTQPVFYGKNIISLAPIQFTNTGVKGVGVHYERVLDDKGIFSFSLPMAMSFNDYRDANVFWMYPGLKIYPTGSNKKVSYAIGPSLALATGSATSYGENREEIFQIGLMATNSLNIQPTPNLYMGLEFGLGFPYLYKADPYNYDDAPLVQFNFKIGYRF